MGIATAGRAAVLRETIAELAAQTRQPDRLLVCATAPSDVADIAAAQARPDILFAAAGLPRQRNALLDAAADCDVLLFLDDDFLPAPGYLAAIEAAFLADPMLVVATGTLIADGIGGPGLDPDAARALVRADLARPAGPVPPVPAFAGYGCNMAIRVAPAMAHGLRVDERLPLYAWQEDVDFTRRLGAFGRVCRLPGARGVHLGTKRGRGSGVRLGYSQVANPLYLARKTGGGAYPYRYAALRIARNLAANLAHAPRPQAHVDRRGRLRGNLIALWDAARGRLTPERVLEL